MNRTDELRQFDTTVLQPQITEKIHAVDGYFYPPIDPNRDVDDRSARRVRSDWQTWNPARYSDFVQETHDKNSAFYYGPTIPMIAGRGSEI